MDKIRDWYIYNTGYVLQLATPYYEELTVRENLTLAAQMRLPKTLELQEKFVILKTLELQEKFDRVEKVMKEVREGGRWGGGGGGD